MNGRLLLILLVTLSLLFTACRTYTFSSGKKYRDFLPVKDKSSPGDIDTGMFIRQGFSLAAYNGQHGMVNNKHIVVSFKGADAREMADSKGKYYIYFWNSVCPGTTDDLVTLDSLAKSGYNIMIAAERSNYDMVHSRLSRTHFSNYPYYVIEDEKYSKLLIQRKIDFIADACPSCYCTYKDNLMLAHLLIKDGEIITVFKSHQENLAN